MTDTTMTTDVREIASAHMHMEGPLLPILHAVQARYGHVPEAAIPVIADVVNLTRAEVFGTFSFYHDFRSAPAGQHVLKICRAEACQSRGGRALESAASKRLGADMGTTTNDGKVTLEAVYCLGLCALAPAVTIDEKVHGRVDEARLAHLIDDCVS